MSSGTSSNPRRTACLARYAILIALGGACAGCSPLRSRDPIERSGAGDPAISELIEAANSKAELERLMERYFEEQEHARILEQNIARLMAAEEGLALQVRRQEASLESLRRDTQRLGREEEEARLELERLRQESAGLEGELEQARAATRAARELLEQTLERSRSLEDPRLAEAVQQLESALEAAGEAQEAVDSPGEP